ncbi:MAG: thylakoid membrane photosystem I accumulation factor [Microcoleaceae cyanobacterium MO_207.B10]|nr:thylakoid membrane photosystem I accumulation factor [Microcoleaceae cyanobacterium MO_207.B10]
MIHSALRLSWQRICLAPLLALFVIIFSVLMIATPTALAGINDDNFDGNIFALYGGNGSLVPARVKLVDSLKGSKPALLVFFVDDSKDCKQFSTVVSQLQAFYGRAANFIPVNVDSIFAANTDDPTKPGYYYQGVIPQTVLIDQEGQVAFNVKGQAQFEQIDDAFREVFDLLPRSESVELKRRVVNEVNIELTN